MTSLMCLAVAVFFEARGETTMGQYAVAEVVMNRVEDPRYPDTVCEVVFEDSQFSFTEHYSMRHIEDVFHDGRPDRLPRLPSSEATLLDTRASRKARTVASDVLGGYRMGISSTHYHTVSVDPFWNEHFELDGKIGNHLFYTNETNYR